MEFKKGTIVTTATIFKRIKKKKLQAKQERTPGRKKGLQKE